MRRVAQVRAAQHAVCQAAHRKGTAAAREGVEERAAVLDLHPRRPPIGIRVFGPMWMGRDDVPEQNVLLEPEIGENAVHDRRGCLGGPGARQLPLGRERDAAEPGSAISRGLTDEEERCRPARLEVCCEPAAQQLRLRVLVERLADTRGGE